MKTTRTVPACHECNAIAGARVFASFRAKRRFIQRRLAERYRKLLAMPSWTEAELDELSPSLRTHVEAALGHRAVIRARLDHRPRTGKPCKPPPEPKRPGHAPSPARQLVRPRLGYYVHILAFIAAQFGDREFSTDDFRRAIDYRYDGHLLRALETRGCLRSYGLVLGRATWALTEDGRDRLAALHAVQQAAAE